MAIRVIGVGTRSGDDAAGLAVAARLHRALPGAVVSSCERPVELLELLRDAEAVVLADAVRSGASPGTLHHLTPADLRRGPGVSSHALGVADALALLDALGRLPKCVHIVGIEAGSAAGEQLSQAVSCAVERAAHWIAAHVRALARGTGAH